MIDESYPVNIVPPDISVYRTGNAGVDYATTYDSGVNGPHTMITAVVHGNELCGAVTLDWLMKENVRPARGKLTLMFCNVAAYLSFDPASPQTSRFVDEDFNRVWGEAALDGHRKSRELSRAREIRPLIGQADLLLDIHSMQHPTLPLMLSGPLEKGRRFARDVGVPATIVSDEGHSAGKRMRDYGAFADPTSPKNALLVECGQHWETKSVDVAKETALRFLLATGTVARSWVEARLPAAKPLPQRTIEVTHAITINSDEFRFVSEFRGLEEIAKAGDEIAHDGDRIVRAPYDSCVLIMPSRRLGKGQTAVRLGRYVSLMAGAPASGIDWKALAVTVMLGTAGGALFRWLTIPLPWMLGAVTFTTIAAMSGSVRITMPRHIRGGFLTILGVLLGASFTPAIISRMHEWFWTAAGLAAWALVAGACAYVYLRRVAGFDPATAYFAATPGGLAEMVLVGSQVGAHVPTLALSHAVRVMLVVLVIPIWFRFEGVITAQSSRALVGLLDVAPADYAILAACAIGGSFTANRLRIPAAGMLGPLLFSVAVHLTGITESQPPYVLTAAAQVVLGSAIGQRFAGTTPRTIAATAMHGIVSTLIMLGLAIAFAAAFAAFTGQTFPGLVLAYAPGGFAEMSLIALALSVDSAFVASHHLIRIILVVTLAPVIFRRFNGPPPPPSEF